MDTPDALDAELIEVDAGFAPSVPAQDAEITASIIGVVTAQDGAALDKSAAAAVFSGAEVGMSQSAAYWVVSKSVVAENVGSAVMVAGNVKLNRGWVGVVASPRAEISEDSRVFIGPAAAAIIALAIFGVFGLVALMAPRLMRQAAELWPELDEQIAEWMQG